MSRIRQREIHSRRIRHKKLAHLRAQYASAKSAAVKDKIIERVSRVSPGLTRVQFEKSVKGE
ncbi:hypothetical protein KKC44_02295 [Patescibacteria group bacterium]|nr:hypothetical protein [Patescibacteria group bacterium]